MRDGQSVLDVSQLKDIRPGSLFFTSRPQLENVL